MNLKKLPIFLFVLQFSLLTILGLHSSWFVAAAQGQEKGYHVVVLSDPHLPGKMIPKKQKVIDAINSKKLGEVDIAAVVGDICFDEGTPKEYDAAKIFLDQLKKPYYPIAGNHDYIYDFKKRKDSQQEILSLFKKTFNLPKAYYDLKEGPYLLIFLSADEVRAIDEERYRNRTTKWFAQFAELASIKDPPHITRISSGQLKWLEFVLDGNKNRPTIIFFHAPLKGTLGQYGRWINTASAIAQPEDKIHTIITKHSQIILWVSGHTHTPTSQESFDSVKQNLYASQVMNVHNPAMEDESKNNISTNSLFLHQDKVVIKTYDHKKGLWLGNERTFTLKTRVWTDGRGGSITAEKALLQQ